MLFCTGFYSFSVFEVHLHSLFVSHGLFTNSDPHPGMDIHPKNGYSNDQGSGSRSESQSWVHAMGTVSVQYNVAIGFGVWIRIGNRVTESMSGNVNKPLEAVESRKSTRSGCYLQFTCQWKTIFLPSVLTMACNRNTIFLVRQTKLDLYITKTRYIMGAFL